MNTKQQTTKSYGTFVRFPLSVFHFLQKFQEEIFLLFLVLMVISLPTSRFGLSVGQFGLLGIWAIGGNLKQKFTRFFNSKAAIVMVLLYLMHVVGMMYTSDWNYGLKDLRIKLPLLWLPVLFVSVDFITPKKMKAVLQIYIGAVVVSTLYSLRVNLLQSVSDFREISPLISHIRLSLNICIALFLSVFYLYQYWNYKRLLSILFGITALWLFFTLIMVESVAGVFIVFIGLSLIGFYLLFKKVNRGLKWAIGIFLLLVYGATMFFLQQTTTQYFTPRTTDFSNLDKYTASGNTYLNDTTSTQIENGEYIFIYVSYDELREAWNQKSNMDFDSLDMKHQSLRGTLVRYMNSKGLRKDAEGFSKLTDKDVRNVEMGIANVEYAKKFSVRSRLYKLFWEYQSYENGLSPEGNTFLQRLEYWKTSTYIIADHFWTGVGTGDVQHAFDRKYQETNSRLSPEVRFRSHNQFLAIFVGFGVFGFFLFLFTLIYPAVVEHKFTNYFYFTFWLTLMISMLFEDTLETQMGVTLFAFFNAFLLFQPRKKTDQVTRNS